MLTPTIGFITVALVAVVGWALVLRYRRRAWRTTRAGRSLMYLIASISGIPTVILILRFAIDDPETKIWIYIVSFGLVLIPLFRLHRDLSVIIKEEKIIKEVEDKDAQ